MELTMPLLKFRVSAMTAVAAVALMTLAGCQDHRSNVAPSPSSGEYSSPSGDAPASSGTPVVVPGQGTDVTAQQSGTGMVGGASGTVGSGGTPGSGSASGAGTGAAASSQGKIDARK
jgi:hypothetical protein